MQRLSGFVLIILLLLFLQGCDSPNARPMKLEGIERTIKLDSGLGSFTIVLPKELDTFFKWGKASDYPAGRKTMHRYMDSRFPVNLEKAYIHTNVPDSAYQFTITHSTRISDNSLYGLSTKEIQKYLYQIRKKELEFFGKNNLSINKDTVISNLPFLIFGHPYFDDGGIHYDELQCITICSNQKVELTFYRKARSPYPTDFVHDAYERIKQIKYTPE